MNECKHNALPFQVMHTPAGFYVGRFCGSCGPYSRNSGYYPTEEVAEEVLEVVMNSGGPRTCTERECTDRDCEHCPHFD